MDTAPGYADGLSEAVVGRALAGQRAGVFVIDRVDALDQPVAPQVEASVARAAGLRAGRAAVGAPGPARCSRAGR